MYLLTLALTILAYCMTVLAGGLSFRKEVIARVAMAALAAFVCVDVFELIVLYRIR